MHLRPRRRALAALTATAVGISACGGGGPASLGPGATVEADGLDATVVQAGLVVPWDIAFLPDGRMVVTERPGRVRVYAGPEPGAALLATTDVPDAYAEGEAGTMGIATESVAEGGEPVIYVCASRDADGPDGPDPWRIELLTGTVDDDGAVAFEDAPLVTGLAAHEHHDGCAVELDPSGRLWMTTGDANSVSTDHLSQVPTSLNGKVLRIERDGSVPTDNPSIGGAPPSEVYSLGHRNPQGIVIGSDGLVLVAEHGTDRDDEINRLEAGGNYGYGCYTGADSHGPARDGTAVVCGAASDYLPPAWASGSPTIATSGIALLPEGWGDRSGMLAVTTLKEQDLRLFEILDGGHRLEERAELLHARFGRLRAAVIGPDGALYVTTSNATERPTDIILRLEPAA